MIESIELLTKHEFARIALCAVLLVSFSSGLLSPLVVLKQRSFWGDALSHLVFPGVLLGLMAWQGFGLPLWLCLFTGAAATALLGSVLLPKLERKLGIPSDSAGIVLLTAFFAIGVVITSKFSHLFAEAHFDLHRFLFGDVLTLAWQDLLPIAFSSLFSFGALAVLRADWDAWVSDPEFAQLAGFRVKWVSALFPILITSTVLCGIWTVGSLMISALITLPAVLVQPSTVLSKASIGVALLIGLVGSLAGFALDIPMGSALVLTGGVFVLFKVIWRSRFQ